jgi:hypothetical protein
LGTGLGKGHPLLPEWQLNERPLQQQFHVDDVKPPAKLEPDLSEVTGYLKAKFCVEGHAASLFTVNAGHDCVVTKRAGAGNQFL